MAAYRFCRSDDIGLLTDALNRCWSPYFPDEPPMTPAAFKRSIRDRQVWCSSCMVAFAGADPIGVLIGAKRPSGTLVHKIAVHPDHRRQEHGRHLLASLGSKLAILGPPRTTAEVPETLAAASRLFSASGYVQEALLTDYVLDPTALSERASGAAGGTRVEGFVIPVTVDDLAANGLLDETPPQACWERSVETLTARKDDIAGLAVASDERIEAYLLYVKRGAGPGGDTEADSQASGPDVEMAGVGVDLQVDVELVSLRSLIEDGGAHLRQLLSRVHARTTRPLRLPKVHPAEFPSAFLDTLGFRPAGGHLLYAAWAGSDQARPV